MDESIFRKVKTASDIRNLPGWVGKVDPQKIGLKRVIWPYHLQHVMPCSLTNCGRAHKDGFLIELEDGSVSNIGHICGADPDKFGDVYVRAKEAMTEEKLRAQMLPALLDRSTLAEIRSRAAAIENSVYLWSKRARKFATQFPSVHAELVRRLNGIGGVAVYEELERTQAEIAKALEAGVARTRSEARYYKVKRGELVGLDLFRVANIPMEIVVRRADALCAHDPTTLKQAEMSRLYSDLMSLPDELDRIEGIVNAGARFFAPDNIKLLSYFPLIRGSRDRLLSLTLDELDNIRLPLESPSLSLEGMSQQRTSGLSKKQLEHLRRAQRQREAAKK